MEAFAPNKNLISDASRVKMRHQNAQLCDQMLRQPSDLKSVTSRPKNRASKVQQVMHDLPLGVRYVGPADLYTEDYFLQITQKVQLSGQP